MFTLTPFEVTKPKVPVYINHSAIVLKKKLLTTFQLKIEIFQQLTLSYRYQLLNILLVHALFKY